MRVRVVQFIAIITTALYLVPTAHIYSSYRIRLR